MVDRADRFNRRIVDGLNHFGAFQKSAIVDVFCHHQSHKTGILQMVVMGEPSQLPKGIGRIQIFKMQ